MATLLLIVIFFSFIGLGIPDSLFGPAWPAMYTQFNLPVSMGGYIMLLISVFTALSSFFSSYVINRLGTGKVTAISTALTALALYGYSVSGNVWLICIFSFPLGLGAGAIDSALNNYVALHYNASQMNFLHCFYGVGVSLSPYLMSFALRENSNWQLGYRYAFYLQMIIVLLTVITLPVWKKVGFKDVNEYYTDNKKEDSVWHMLKKPSVQAVSLIFITSCSIEFSCGTWGSTFLVNAKGLPIDMAAKFLTFYYVGMTLGRFLSGVLATKLSAWRIVKLGFYVISVALIVLVLPFDGYISGIALFLIGVGNGPVYPNFVHLTPKNFGEKASQSVMGIQIGAAYIGIMAMPTLFGVIAQRFSLNTFSWFLIILYIIMALSLVNLIRLLKLENKYE